MKRKIIWLVVLLIILIGGGVLCYIRWDVWFTNLPEPDYVVPVRPNNIVISYGEDALSERTISWRCDTVVQDACLLLAKVEDIADDMAYPAPLPSDTIAWYAEGHLVESRAGKAAFYKAELHNLSAGKYAYCCITGDEESAWKHFVVSPTEGDEFVLFGDVQDVSGTASRVMYDSAFHRATCDNQISFMAFVGDIIERPMDMYWQIWFRSMQDKQTSTPIIAATGNHEYLKGVHKVLDSRWTSVFVNSQNGPQRFAGRTYYVDFPLYRFIVLDTDALQLFSDYTITQTWLHRTLQSSTKRWNIVMMHHPIYTAAMKHRDYPLIRFSFRHALEMADVVFCGHDHNYMRREIAPYIQLPWNKVEKQNTVQILTVSSEKFYEPKDSIVADKHIAGQSVYEAVKVSYDSLCISTYLSDKDSIVDQVVITKPR